MRENISKENETIDLKSTALKYINYWYYFVICILLSVFIAFLYNRYRPPIYNISTSLLIRDDNNTQLGAENILEGLEIYSGKRNIKNEIVILNSYALTNQVIEKLGLGISYYQHGFLKTNELYKNSPFQVEIDSSSLQLAGIDFKVQIIDEENLTLKVSAKDHYTYNVNTDKNNQTVIANVSLKEDYKFSEEISNEYFNLKINKTPYFNLAEIKSNNKTYSFRLNYRSNLVRAYIKNVEITPITKETSVLLLSNKSKTHKKSSDFLNTLTECYIKNGLREKNLMATNTINFIDEQLIIIQDSLLIIENELERFRKKNPNLKVAEKDFGTFFQKQRLDNTLYDHNIQIKYYNSLLKYLDTEYDAKNIVSPTSIGITNPELNSLITQLIQQNAKKEELQLITTEKNPSFQAILAQIRYTRDAIIENVKNLISTSKIYQENLESRIGNIDETIKKLPEVEKQFIILQRNYELNESTVKYLKEKRYEASLAKAGNDSDHKIIDTAKLNPAKAISPKKGLSYLIALFFGFFVPIIYISLRDFFSNVIRNKSDIEMNSKIPILGLLGHSDKATSFFIEKNPKSITAEAFRSLRTNIQYLASDKDKKIITLTSGIAGEGKTFCAMNLAGIFALSGNKTILIGGDLRKPKIHEIFGKEIENGLSTYLINKIKKEDIILKSNIDTLDIICSGPIPPNPSELLDSDRMSKLISELHKEYDYVIIDTPPIGLVTDGVILMKQADINLFIIRHQYTKIKSLVIPNNLFNQNIIKNLNIIINDYKYEGTSYGGYGYGYNYESGGYGYYEES